MKYPLRIALAIIAFAMLGGHASASAVSDTVVYNLKNYGLKPDRNANSSPLIRKAMEQIAAKHALTGKPGKIVLPRGKYHFFIKGSVEKELYISNHDQVNPKNVGLLIDGMKNIVFDGNGSELVFHGRMLPVAMLGTSGCTLRNMSIDFANPYISQIEIVENDPAEGITYKVAPWVEYEVADSVMHSKGDGWETVHSWGIAFDGATGRLVYNTSDIPVGTQGVVEVAPRIIKSPRWKDSRLKPGTVVAMRGWERPAPGIFAHACKNTAILGVKVHYAEGMGLLAQLCENFTLDRFGVCLRGEDDQRYFTTQADATHFSGCRGLIKSVNGLYEGMMDDAINVHGTYLKVVAVENDSTVIGQYMHGQSYGFDWGFKGDSVTFVKSRAMEMEPDTLVIKSIKAVDAASSHGAKQFRVAFDRALPAGFNTDEAFGMENISWTPAVVFADNVVRNNRARGALFSTPKPVLAERNFFDHTSGTAILLCGDCNGWYETGACRNVVIRDNHFLNALTNMFQFTNAVISIYPEIPALAEQNRYFHSGIVIEGNLFDTFDAPVLYAKSVNGLVFRNNKVRHNHDFPAFHWNKFSILLERVVDCAIEQNESDTPIDIKVN